MNVDFPQLNFNIVCTLSHTSGSQSGTQIGYTTTNFETFSGGKSYRMFSLTACIFVIAVWTL